VREDGFPADRHTSPGLSIRPRQGSSDVSRETHTRCAAARCAVARSQHRAPSVRRSGRGPATLGIDTTAPTTALGAGLTRARGPNAAHGLPRIPTSHVGAPLCTSTSQVPRRTSASHLARPASQGRVARPRRTSHDDVHSDVDAHARVHAHTAMFHVKHTRQERNWARIRPYGPSERGSGRLQGLPVALNSAVPAA
jgi:hypothetical protein